MKNLLTAALSAIAGLKLFLAMLSVLAVPAWSADSKGLKLYSDYYQKNKGSVQVYYDSIDENGQLVGGKVTLPLEPVDTIKSRTAAPPAWGYETIFANGPSENRIDIVILGDGYTEAQLDDYAAQTNSILQGYFAKEPLASYINFFNVHRVDVISSESGVDEPDNDIYKNTALDMNYNCGGIARLLCISNSKAWDAASVAPQAEQILALANSSRYGGSGSPNLATMAGDNDFSVELALHEFGHSFGKIADEYTYGGSEIYTGPEPSQINVSIYQASQIEQVQTKWYRWLDLSNVGTYEGAKLSKYGIYRPTYNSIMRTLGYPFEVVNSEQLIFEIYKVVSVIDNATPQFSAPVSNHTVFYVVPVQPVPNTIDIQWYIDGQPVDGATDTEFIPDKSKLTSGVHDVSVTVVDNTTSVRDEGKRALLMTETLQWQIKVDKTPDLNGDYMVDLNDFSMLAMRWYDADCWGDNSFCNGADLDTSGQVDLLDIDRLCTEWLTDYRLPQAHWKFDDDGDTANDDTGNGHTGTLFGNPVWVDGYHAGALEFDGDGDYVEISGYKGISGGASRTCMAWIKTTQVSGEIITWGNTDAGAKWIIRVDGTGTLRAEVNGGNIIGTTPVNDGTWHHIAVVINNDGTPDISEAMLYVDGMLETISALVAKPINTAQDQDVAIGVFTTTGISYFHGQIDDVRIYDRPLDEPEIQTIYNQ